ncbi:MAG: PilZ domain-containing protein [Acidobacteria bacterium]|nr:PilZ domain-containing protein [Acidobacteriota bacterium]
MAGAARLFCESCTRETYWFYTQHSDGSSTAGRTAQPPARMKASNGAVEASAASAGGESATEQKGPIRTLQMERRMGTERRHRSRRAQRRVALQVPVRVRLNSPASQFEEVTRTVNVCRNGIYIQSERPYARGSPIYVAMNYSPKEPTITAEQKATVVRVDPLAGTAARGIAIQLH